MYKGDRSLLSSAATHMRIHQQKPGLASWGVWRKAMALWAIDCDLRVPLKEWYFPASQLLRHWPTYYEYTTDNLYVHHQDTFLQYTRDQEKGIFHSESESTWTPTAPAVPIKVNTMDGTKTFDRSTLLWCTTVYTVSSGWNISKFCSGLRQVVGESIR